MTINIPEFLADWWAKYCPDPTVDVNIIESGDKNVVATGDAPSDSAITSTCQYWIKGLSAPCQNWDWQNTKCIYEIDQNDATTIPTGYGIGYCDGLGRREWCSKYNPVDGYDESNYTCVLPCIEKSGSGKQESDKAYVSLRPWLPTEIKGYNPDENGVAQCDGLGMGRGSKGLGKTTVEDMRKIFPTCRHYKPHQMGFGVLLPRPYPSDPSDPPQYVWKQGTTYIPTTDAQLYSGSKADPLVMMDKRLPFAFRVYNLRAQLQKCAHWDDDYGSDFYIDEIGPDGSLFNIVLDIDPSEKCICNSSACKPYKTLPDDYMPNLPWVINEVWAESNSIICNGAKPECPCYTGRWVYCVDKNMADGMRITADQLFELRFWTSNWGSQDEYDRFFENMPGTIKGDFADETTADIYTFTYWEKLDPIDVNKSVMIGNKHHMCMPVSLTDKQFDPKKYITIEEIQYPTLNEYHGTHTVGEVSYPTLVRELPDGVDVIPDINVVYPYFTIDPWNVAPCDNNLEDYCYHDNSIMYDSPKINIIGSCVRDKEVWAINITYAGHTESDHPATATMTKYVRTQLIPETQRAAFYKDVDNLISQYDTAGNGAYVYGVTDEYGYFDLSTLNLKNNFMNYIFIICKYDEGETSYYTHRIRKVKSRYFGGLICQTSFDQECSSHQCSNTLLASFSSPATVEGNVEVINGKISDILSAYSIYQRGLYNDYIYYTYCLNEVEVEETNLITWTQIGATEYILINLNNILISYLWDVEIEKIYLTPNVDSDGNFVGGVDPKLCDQELSDLKNVKITLTKVDIDRKTLPPDTFLFKAPSVMSFFNDDWQLYVKYKYQIFENVMGSSVKFPEALDSSLSANRFMNPPFTINHKQGEQTFSVSNISKGTVAVMAKIVDQDGRVQSCAATKMILVGSKVSCRNIEIFYEYTGDAIAYDLRPQHGFFTYMDTPTAVATDTNHMVKHMRQPLCGDHEFSQRDGIGPLWFPFNDCNIVDFYNVLNGAAFCTMPITEALPNIKKMGYGGWRYGVADEYQAWVTDSSNWLSACGNSFYYHYSRADMMGMGFTGYARKKGVIDVYTYLEHNWTLPPFGNLGRNMTERWLIKDFFSFLDMSSGEPRSSEEYMPYVIDLPDIENYDLNCFSGSYSNDIFRHFPLLSTMVSLSVLESDPAGRYKFDDIIDLIYQAGCSYPTPIITSKDGGTDTIVRYGLKNEDYLWLWQESWKPIERNVDSGDIQSATTLLDFVNVIYPDYYFDYTKKENQMIMDEGSYTIKFTPPVIKRKSVDGNSEPAKYPSISIDGVFPRYFKIIYDEYDNSNVLWEDESATGEIGGSGGSSSENGNIYEKANGQGSTTWMHDFDTIFAAGASSTPNDERKIALGQDDVSKAFLYGYYNRGLIMKIPKNKLYRLPIDNTEIPEDSIIDDGNSITRYNYNVAGFEDYAAATRVVIRGYWGVKKVEDSDTDSIVSFPGITVAEVFEEDVEDGSEINDSFPKNVVYSGYAKSGLNSKDGDGNITFQNFDIDVALETTPNRLSRKVQYFQIKIEPYRGVGLNNYEDLNITEVTAYVGKYKEAIEKIKIHERRYLVSTRGVGQGSDIKNADGPDTATYRQRDQSGKNAGQYFPSSKDVMKDGGYVMSKTTIAGTSEAYYDDEDIEVNIGSLKTVEKEEQANQYKEALTKDIYDKLQFKCIIPPVLQDFLKSINAEFSTNKCVMIQKKILWEDTYYNSMLNQSGDFFQPGGHYFEWSDRAFKTQCYTGSDKLQTVYEVDWVHNKHGGIQPTMWTGYSWTGWVKYGAANCDKDDKSENCKGYLYGVLTNIDAVGGSAGGLDLFTQANALRYG